MKKTFYLSAFAVGLSSLNAANAATATGTLTVRATVTNSCVLNTSATGTTANAVLDFGTLSSLAGNVDADTTTTGGTPIRVLCNNTVPWTLSFDGGQNVLSTQRRMIGGASTTEYIPYNLYSDTGRATAIELQQLLIVEQARVMSRQLTCMAVSLLVQLYQVQVAMLTL